VINADAAGTEQVAATREAAVRCGADR